MAFSVADLRDLRRYLEALASGFAALPEARDLYAADAETAPDVALSRFVFKLELKASYSGAALRAVLPALGEAEVDSVFLKAIREDNLPILQVCWPAVPVFQRERAAAAVAYDGSVPTLEWILAQGKPSADVLEEGLMGAVWRGNAAVVDFLLPLVGEPWRVLKVLRTKGQPQRPLAFFDERWAAALVAGTAAAPTGRVLTHRFRRDMPRVSSWAQAATLEVRLHTPLSARSRSRM